MNNIPDEERNYFCDYFLGSKFEYISQMIQNCFFINNFIFIIGRVDQAQAPNTKKEQLTIEDVWGTGVLIKLT